MKNLFFALLALLMLTGCGANYDVGPDMVALAISEENAHAACVEAWARTQKVDCTGMESRDCAMVRMQQQTAAIVGMATGKDASPCGKGETLFSVMREEVAQKNATARSLGGKALGTVGVVAGIWGVTEVVDSSGKNAGSTSNVSTEGGDSSISTSRTQTETHSTATNTGDEGVATTNPGSGGEDLVPIDTATEPIVPLE